MVAEAGAVSTLGLQLWIERTKQALRSASLAVRVPSCERAAHLPPLTTPAF
jgi:hypothetical protein